MIDNLVLSALRVVPTVLLAPIPVPVTVRIALGVALTSWIATASHSRPLDLANAATEVAFGLLLGLALLLASEIARGSGVLFDRPFRTASMTPMMAALFWVVFFSGPHGVWLRAVAAPAAWPAASVGEQLALCFGSIVGVCLPVLVSYAAIETIAASVRGVLDGGSVRERAVPLLCLLALGLGLHASSGLLNDSIHAQLEEFSHEF